MDHALIVANWLLPLIYLAVLVYKIGRANLRTTIKLT